VTRKVQPIFYGNKTTTEKEDEQSDSNQSFLGDPRIRSIGNHCRTFTPEQPQRRINI
jgi:hypothetical protein